MYIRPERLQLLHYLYYSLSIFNFSSALVSAPAFAYFYYFLSFFLIHMALSWYVEYALRKTLSGFISISSASFATKHIAVTALSSLAAMLFWLSTPTNMTLVISFSSPRGPEFFDSVVFLNYFTLSMSIFWLVLARTSLVSSTLKLLHSGIIEKAKLYFISEAKKRTLLERSDIESYRYGSDRLVDRCLIKAWEDNDPKKLLSNIKAIEARILSNSITEIKRKLDSARDPKEVSHLSESLKLKEEKLRKLLSEQGA